MADERVIGIENRLPWKLPADMKWFRQHTLGKPIVMGRKTFESFGARPLPERKNIVITRDKNYQAKGIIVVNTIDEALKEAGAAEEVMIIGGASFYEQMLAKADRLYITQVHGKFDGDAFFPVFDMSVWKETSCEEHVDDEKNPYRYSFSIFDRK